MIETQKQSARLRLWQLISPALPVGAYAYSQGLETAIEEGWVSDEQTVSDWIGGVMVHSLIRLDVPILTRFYQAWQQDDSAAVIYWNQLILAMRESAELRQEDLQLGHALSRLLNDLGLTQETLSRQSCSYLSQFSLAAVRWQIPVPEAASGYLWSWCENQVAAAIKLMPLGQTAGQRILGCLIELIDTQVTQGLELNDDEIGSVLPGLAMASAWHETQYSRLFRS